MNPTNRRRLAGVLAVLAAAAWSPAARAGKVSDAVQKMERSVGLEKLRLKPVERDARTGKPTLEITDDPSRKVERRTVYHANGKKSSQETRIIDKIAQAPVYIERMGYDKHGRLISESTQNSKFGANGLQIDGDSRERNYVSGRVVQDVKRKWSPEKKAWVDVVVETRTYYPDGHPKEQVVEDFASNEKTRDSWVLNPNGKWLHSVHHWDSKTNRWQ